MPSPQKISGLMSVYHGTDAGELLSCFDSIFAQTCPLDELIVVLDGPVNAEVKKTLQKFGKKIRTVSLPENHGLAIALNAGLAKCRHPLIARFDADDIFPPERLKLQANHMAAHSEVAILGGQIAEFENTPGDKKTKNIRQVPLRPRAGLFTLMRNPLNHMTVMFRRDAIRALGGYRAMGFMQDYELWLRALAAGYKLANLPEILAHARIGSGMHARRRGGDEWAIYRTKKKVFPLYWRPLVFLASLFRAMANSLPASMRKAVSEMAVRK